MKRMVWALFLASTVLAMSNRPAVQAAVVRPLAFDEMVRQAALIVRGSVVETRSYVRGVGVVRNEAQKDGRLPASEAGRPGTPEAPQSAGTRGGRMIFTHVVLRADEAVKGEAGQTVEFDIAGGTVDGRTVWIPSMPTFDRGGDYVVFLREGYEKAGDPILGVNQGFFRVLSAGTPGAVLNHDFDFVVAIEQNRVVPRLNAQRGAFRGAERPIPQVAGGPVPDAGGTTATSAGTRYLTSTEPPLTVDQFVATIRARLGR